MTTLTKYKNFNDLKSSENLHIESSLKSKAINNEFENFILLLRASMKTRKTSKQKSIDTLEFKAETSPNPKESFFKFEDSHFTLDFLPKLIGEDKFSDLFRRVEIVNVDEVEIYFLGYEDLIAEKIKTSRLKDLKDIEELSQIKKRKS